MSSNSKNAIRYIVYNINTGTINGIPRRSVKNATTREEARSFKRRASNSYNLRIFDRVNGITVS